MDDADLAFAGAAEQVRMLAEGTVTAPGLLADSWAPPLANPAGCELR
ncbi:hypothetical protein [Candidatus Mycobacterium methanotrophicum]|nr:hypothetical protein [Candidatus Mycobacterium methanotrophicum]